jgi:hypothetical protein
MQKLLFLILVHLRKKSYILGQREYIYYIKIKIDLNSRGIDLSLPFLCFWVHILEGNCCVWPHRRTKVLFAVEVSFMLYFFIGCLIDDLELIYYDGVLDFGFVSVMFVLVFFIGIVGVSCSCSRTLILWLFSGFVRDAGFQLKVSRRCRIIFVSPLIFDCFVILGMLWVDVGLIGLKELFACSCFRRMNSLKWEKNWGNNVNHWIIDIKQYLNLKEIKRSWLMVEIWKLKKKKLRGFFLQKLVLLSTNHDVL